MAAEVLGHLMARDGSGLWEVTHAGIHVNGKLWRFTERSSVVCAITPGHTETHTELVENPDDGFGALAALAVYQETGSQATPVWRHGRSGVPRCARRRTPRSSPALFGCPSTGSAVPATATARCAIGRTAFRCRPTRCRRSPTRCSPPSTISAPGGGRTKRDYSKQPVDPSLLRRHGEGAPT